MKQQQLPALTGLRFFAALWVVLFHFTAYWRPGAWGDIPGGGTLTAVLLRGDLGVVLFFVLSGFILTHTYLDGAGMRGTLRSFWVSRIARIYPAYAVALLVALPPAAWAWVASPHAAAAVIATPLLLQAWVPDGLVWNAPGWSLSTEAFFYALFPLVLPAFARCADPWKVWLLVGLAGALATLGRMAQLDPFWPVVQLPAFLAGLAAGCAYRRGLVLPAWCGYLGGIIVLALCLGTPTVLIAAPLLTAPCFVLLIGSLAAGRGALARLLSTARIVRLGEASYALYLLHYPLWDWLMRLLGAPRWSAAFHPGIALPLGSLSYLALALLVSLLVYTYLETPARRAIRRYSFHSSTTA